MPDQAISALSSADPASTALVPVVVNATTVQTNLAEAVGYWSTAAGDMVYADGARSLARLAIGTSGSVLESTGGIPAWKKSNIGAGLSQTGSAAPATGYAAFSFNTEDYDADGMASTAAAATSQIVIRTPGVYLLNGFMQYSASSPASASALGGAALTVDGSIKTELLAPLTAAFQTFVVTAVASLSSGQAVGLYTYLQSTNATFAGKPKLAAQLLARL